MTPFTPIAGTYAFARCTSLAKLIIHDGHIPKDLREARITTTIDLLRRLLKQTGANPKPVPKVATLITWPAPDTLANIGRSASRIYPRLAEPNQPRRLRYRSPRMRFLQQICGSELEVWVSELEIFEGPIYKAVRARTP